MTMKTKKTLQHIAAVAVVLLTLCLVFAAPVSAAPFTTTVVVGEDTFNTLEAAIAEAIEKDSSISLPEYGYEFALADDNWFYTNAAEKTGRLVYLNISVSGNSEVVTTYCVNGGSTAKELQDIVKYTDEGFVQDGDIVLLPAGDLYIQIRNPSPISENITIAGAGADTTKLYGIGSNTARIFMVSTRISSTDAVDCVITFKNLTLSYAGTGTGQTSPFWFSSGYANITANIENVYVNGFSLSAAFKLEAANNEDVSGVGITVNLKNVHTSENGYSAELETKPNGYTLGFNNAVGFAYFNYDESDCSFSDIGETKFGTVSYKLYNNNPTLYLGNALINGEDVTLDSAVAKIGDTYYGTLQDAVNKAAENDVITLLKNIDVDTGVLIEKSLTITSEAGKKYTISNDNVKSGNNGATIVVNKDNIALNLENVIVTANHYAIRLLNKSTVEITNSEINGYSALYFKEGADGSTVTVSKSTLVGTDKWSGIQDDFGTIVSETGNVTVTVTDSTVKAIAEGTANQSIVLISDWYAPNNNNKVIFTGGELVLEKGSSPASTFVVINTSSTGNSVVVNAGVTANFNPSAYIAGGMEVVQPGDKYLVQTYVDRSSSGGSSSAEPEEPEQPEEPVVEPETPAAPGEVAASTEVTDGGDVTFETPAGEDGTAPAPADDEIKGVVLPTGTEGTVEFVPVSEQPAPAGQEENTKRVFEINVPSYKKGEASVIKFQMTVAEIEADGKTAADVALWHYDEETGEWTKLVTTFVIKDGIVYFEAITNDFSPFAIVYADEPAEELPTDQPEEPTETPASPAPVLAVIAALGAAVVLRRK